MKASRILFGIGVGVAAGFVVALQGRRQKCQEQHDRSYCPYRFKIRTTT